MVLNHFHFFSRVLGLTCTLSVLLPDRPGTVEDETAQVPEGPYPTLYLLHGLSDDHTIWQRRTSIERYIDRLHESGRDLAVVMPAVHRSFYTNMAAGGRYWTFISEEVPALVRGYFNLSAARADNFVAGLSMGGYGAFKLALAHPERFAAAASLSGALDVVRLMRLEETLNEGELKYTFGSSGALAGSPNDLFYLAEQAASRGVPRPALYQWCGTEDVLYDDNVRFHDHLQRLGFEVAYAAEPGTHEWVYWDQQIEKVLEWLPL
jgi:S-formylglutathione hydrolase FrmB